jgi:uncharacterized protein (TIGR03546 family)
MFWINIVTNFIKILRDGQTPRQIAGGCALGSLVGLSPSLTLQGLTVWLVILVLDVNLTAAMLAFTLFSLLAFLLDPIFHHFGYFLLVDITALKGLWTTLYNAPIAPLTRFNNTVVLGSFLTGLALLLPVHLGMSRLVVAYRSTIGRRIEQWKVYRILSKSSLVQWYKRIRDLGV